MPNFTQPVTFRILDFFYHCPEIPVDVDPGPGPGGENCPSITTEPQDFGTGDGNNAQFSVVASGSDLTYRWQVSEDGGTIWQFLENGGVYSGATTATLTLTAVGLGYTGFLYRAVVSREQCPDAFSDSAELTVAGASLGCVLVCESTGSIDIPTCGPFYPGVSDGPDALCSAVNANCLGNPEGDPGMVTQTVDYHFDCTGLTIGQWYRIDYTLAANPAEFYFQATAPAGSTPTDSVPFPTFPGENTVSGGTICPVTGPFQPC